MALTIEQLWALLTAEEPNYPALAPHLDAATTPHLETLARGADVMTASKAVYAASLSSDTQAHRLVEEASRSSERSTRLAAASALVNLPESVRAPMIEHILGDDADAAAQKLAIRSMGQITSEMRRRLTHIQQSTRFDSLRNLARQKLSGNP
jgi:hypothetical protein